MNTETIVALICAVLASTGLWTFISKVWEKKHSNNTAERNLLVGLAHDRIIYLANCYISRDPQYITQDEYENLHDYLYLPYAACGGNGSAERAMKEVEKLPLRSANYNGDLNK